jgi:hypothetical protein
MYSEQQPGDQIISRPPQGNGASLTIRYHLPRKSLVRSQPVARDSRESASSSSPVNQLKKNGVPELPLPTDWYWEGNVVDAVVRYLSTAGWTVISKADTNSRERGIDVHAVKDGITLLIEAKGYPSESYRDPLRASERKPTSPTLQAQHWYSHALLKMIRLQTAHTDALIALALPNFPRYQKLYEETRESLQKLSIAVLFVERTGDVRAFGLP